jgi:hypothetical protein
MVQGAPWADDFPTGQEILSSSETKYSHNFSHICHWNFSIANLTHSTTP